MNKNTLIRILEQDCKSVGKVAEHALAILNTAKNVVVEENPTPIEKKHWLSIYSRRLARSGHTGKQVIGLEETFNAFTKGEGPFRAIAITADTNTIYCWIDCHGHLVGCITG